MYFDDLEMDLDLSNSFEALVDHELGQIGAEVDVQVDIPSSSLPTKEEIEEWERVGLPEWTITGPRGTKPLQPELYAPPIGTKKVEPAAPRVTIPRVQRVTPVTSDLAALQRRELVEDIVNDLTQRLLPRLKKIDKRLKLAAAQRKATDEHNIIMEREKFRQRVILELKHLSQLLPVNHPVRQRIAAL